jgi:hypothetical protein
MRLGLGGGSAVVSTVMSERRKSFRPFRLQRVPLSLFLAGTIGLAMLIAMGLMIFITLGTARDNTARLLGDKAQLVLALVRERIDQFLEPAEALTASIARSIERGDLDPADEAELVVALSHALAAAPQINAAVFVDPGGWLVSVYRDGDGIGFEREDWRDDPAVAAAVARVRGGDDMTPHWGPPLYRAGAGTTLIVFAHPVREPDSTLGIVVATTRVEKLSEFIASIETPGEIGTFLLYDRDHVMAHAAMAEEGNTTSAERVLPTLAELGDPALELIWAEGWEDRRIPDFPVDAHWVDGPTDAFVYLYEDLQGDHDLPWTVGGYFRAADIGREWRRVNQVTGIALGLLVVSLLGAAPCCSVAGWPSPPPRSPRPRGP